MLKNRNCFQKKTVTFYKAQMNFTHPNVNDPNVPLSFSSPLTLPHLYFVDLSDLNHGKNH